MSAISYANLTGTLGQLDALRHRARTLDAIESHLVIQAARTAKLPGVELYAGFARANAQEAWGRTESASSRLRSCHEWFSQSEQSLEALKRGVDAWATANKRSLHAHDAMRDVVSQARTWKGAGAEEQSGRAARQLESQEQLVEITGALRHGCARTRTVMKAVFEDLSLTLTQELNSARGTALRNPSVWTGIFALNSRLRSTASALERAAAEYEAVRGGRGWRGQADGLADIFTENGAQLSDLVTRLRQARFRALPMV